MFKSVKQAKAVADNARTGFRRAKEAGNLPLMVAEQARHNSATAYLRANGWGK